MDKIQNLSPRQPLLKDYKGRDEDFSSSRIFEPPCKEACQDAIKEENGGGFEAAISSFFSFFVDGLTSISNGIYEFLCGVPENSATLFIEQRQAEAATEVKLDDAHAGFVQNLASVNNSTANQVDEAVEKCIAELEKLNKKHPIAPQGAETSGERVLSKKLLRDALARMPKTYSVNVLEKFLANIPSNSATSGFLHANEATIISALMSEVMAEKIAAGLEQQKVGDAEREKLPCLQKTWDAKVEEAEKILASKKADIVSLVQNGAKSAVLDAHINELDQLQKKLVVSEKERKRAIAEEIARVDLIDNSNQQSQQQLKLIKTLTFLSYVAWLVPDYNAASKVLQEKHQHRFAPNRSVTDSFNFAVGVKTGFTTEDIEAIVGEEYAGSPKAYIKAAMGFSYSNKEHVDHEGYLCFPRGLFEIYVNVKGEVKALLDLDEDGTQLGLAGLFDLLMSPQSIGGRYFEYGTIAKFIRHQFPHTGEQRHKANFIEYFGHIFDKVIIDDDPELELEKLGGIDAAMQKFEDTYKQMHEALSLYVSSIDAKELQDAKVAVPYELKHFAARSESVEESAVSTSLYELKKAQIKSRFQDSVNAEIEELKHGLDWRLIKDIEDIPVGLTLGRDRGIVEVQRDIKLEKDRIETASSSKRVIRKDIEDAKRRHEKARKHLNQQNAKLINQLTDENKKAIATNEHEKEVAAKTAIWKEEIAALEAELLESGENHFSKEVAKKLSEQKIALLNQELAHYFREPKADKLARQNKADHKIHDVEATVRLNKLKIDFLFELLPLESAQAKNQITKLIDELIPGDDEQAKKQRELLREELGVGNHLLPITDVSDDKYKEISTKHFLEIEKEIAKSKIEKLGIKHDFEVAEVKRLAQPAINEAHKTLTQLQVDDTGWGDDARAAEVLRDKIVYDRDVKIREVGHKRQLAELAIENEFHLLAAKILEADQGAKDEINKEHELEQLAIRDSFNKENCNNRYDLKLHDIKRGLNYKAQREVHPEHVLAPADWSELNFARATEKKSIEKEFKLAKLDIESKYEKDPDRQQELETEKTLINKEAELDTLERKRKVETAKEVNEEANKLDGGRLNNKIREEIADRKLVLIAAYDAEIKQKEQEIQDIKRGLGREIEEIKKDIQGEKDRFLTELKRQIYRNEESISKDIQDAEIRRKETIKHLEKQNERLLNKLTEKHKNEIENFDGDQLGDIEALKERHKQEIQGEIDAGAQKVNHKISELDDEISVLEKELEFYRDWNVIAEEKGKLTSAKLTEKQDDDSQSVVDLMAEISEQVELEIINNEKVDAILKKPEWLSLLNEGEKAAHQKLLKGVTHGRTELINTLEEKETEFSEHGKKLNALEEREKIALKGQDETSQKINQLVEELYTANEKDKKKKLAQIKHDENTLDWKQSADLASRRPEDGVDLPHPRYVKDRIYLTDYTKGRGSIRASGVASIGVGSASAKAGVNGEWVQLSRQKHTSLGLALTKQSKFDEEKAGIKKLIGAQLDSKTPHVESFIEKLAFWNSTPANKLSVKESIIDGWRKGAQKKEWNTKVLEEKNVFNKRHNENLTVNVPTVINTTTFKELTDTHDEVYVDSAITGDAHFTIQQCQKYLEEDIQLYARCFDETGVINGYESIAEDLQARYAAKEPWEIIKHMGYFVGHLIGLAEFGEQYQVASDIKNSDYIDKKQVAALEKKLLTVENSLFSLKSNKKEHWMEWGIQEYGTIKVQSLDAGISGEIGVNGLGLAGSVGAGIQKAKTNREHSVAGRNGDYEEKVTTLIEISGGVSNAFDLVCGKLDSNEQSQFNQLFQDTLEDYGIFTAEGFGEDPVSGLGKVTYKVTSHVRSFNLARLDPFYKELDLPVPGMTEVYSYKMITIDVQGGVNLCLPLTSITHGVVPIDPTLVLGKAKTTSNMSSDKFPVKTFNQLDTLYSHARDNNDFEKYWLPGIKDGHRLDVEELFSSLGKEQFEEDKNLTRLSNELEARGLEFKRNHILETEKFWEFNKAKEKFLTMASYFYAIKNAGTFREENEKVRRDALHKVWVTEGEIAKSNRNLKEYHKDILRAVDQQETDALNKKIRDEQKKLDGLNQGKKNDQVKELSEINQFYDDREFLFNNTLSIAKKYFLEKGLKLDDSESVKLYEHCFKIFENWASAYYPHTRVLFETSNRHEVSTVGVDGKRWGTYNKDAVEENRKKALKIKAA